MSEIPTTSTEVKPATKTLKVFKTPKAVKEVKVVEETKVEESTLTTFEPTTPKVKQEVNEAVERERRRRWLLGYKG